MKMSDERTPTRGELLALVERWELSKRNAMQASMRPGQGWKEPTKMLSDALATDRCVRELRALLEATDGE